MPLLALLRALWALRLRLALATLTLYAAGASVILLWPRSYVASAVVAPAETTAVALSSLLAPTPFAPGGLLDPRPTGNFAVYLGALRSIEAARLLTETTPLLDYLTALRSAGLGGLARQTFDLRLQADLDDAQDWLERNLAVTQNLASVTWSLELPHRERDQALLMLEKLHAYAEAKVRHDLAELSARRVATIEARLARESDMFLRNSLYDLLAQQQRAVLVVAAGEAVAARMVSAPAVELRPSLPNRPLLLALLALAAPAATLLATSAILLLRASEGAS